MTQPSPVFELRVVITADDYPAAVRLYRDVLGLPLIREFEGAGGGGSLLAAGQATVEVLARETATEIDRLETGKVAGDRVRLALEVADSTEIGEEMEEAGATRLGGPVATPWGGHTNVRLRRPDGLEISLFTVAPPEDD